MPRFQLVARLRLEKQAAWEKSFPSHSDIMISLIIGAKMEAYDCPRLRSNLYVVFFLLH